MKVNRELLKEIVKECLVEILTEGVGNSLIESKNTHAKLKSKQEVDRRVLAQAQPQSIKRTIQQLPPRADYMPASSLNAKKQPDRTAKVVESITDNPIMQEMLASAQSTLQEQIRADRPGTMSAIASNHRGMSTLPDDDPGIDISPLQQSADIWAKLAFSDPAVKK